MKTFSLSDEACESIRRFHAEYGEQLRTFAMHGWFIAPFHTPIENIYPLAKLFNGNEADKAHQQLIVHFNKIQSDIELSLSQDFTERATVIHRAFEAHRRKNYELSIPVMLIQADGISKEIIGASIYSQSSRKMLQLFVDRAGNENKMEKDLLQIALRDMPINFSKKDADAAGKILNRHEILHGINSNYASPLNSCRAISWLQYVAHFNDFKILT